MCVAETLPVIKWFSPSDQSQELPIPIKCYRVDKSVEGFSFRDWASWYKLGRLLDQFPPL